MSADNTAVIIRARADNATVCFVPDSPLRCIVQALAGRAR